MLDCIWDLPVALGTAPIFDDAVYLSEALGLPMNQNEDHLDAELVQLARESGISDPYRFISPPKTISRAISTMTLDSDQRSSRSIQSQETQSTSFTSAPSRTSKDNLFSSSASSRQALPTRKRGSAIFSMFRRDSGSLCTTPTSHHGHYGHHSKPRGAKLACGHMLSDHDIRAHIQEALKRGSHAMPDCCGSAIPHSVVDSVRTTESHDITVGTTAELSDTLSRDSGYCEAAIATVESPPHTIKSLPISDKAPTWPQPLIRRTRHEAISIDSTLANEAFKSYRTQQKEQLERVSLFECGQRKALAAYHHCAVQQLETQHKAYRNERVEQHNAVLDRLEERQLLAEHDLLKVQAQETQNVATALKHIEAYCLGPRSDQERAHTVTEEDIKRLGRQRLIQQDLPRRHASVINVLRARQEMDTGRRLEAQEAKLRQLDTEHEKEKATKETESRKELERLDTVIEARRKRLLQRWDLKFEMWRRDWEAKHNTALAAELEHEDWPSREADHALSIPEASLLAHYVESAT